jgi:6-phosphogluconolactonase
MDDAWLALVGTWDDRCYSYRGCGADRFEERAAVANDAPSFLAVHPSGEFVYAVNEIASGAVTAFAIEQATGALDRIDRQHTGGSGPCHLAVDATGSLLAVAHYGDGSVTLHPIGLDGEIEAATATVTHEGSSVHPDRQTGPHAHAAVFGPENRMLYVPDLGVDRVFAYRIDHETRTLDPAPDANIDCEPGAGPRHLAFGPAGASAYLVTELDSTIVTFERRDEGVLEPRGTVSTLPPEFGGESTAAAIESHPSGDWVYASNRGHDSIGRFAVDEDGGLDPSGHESTRGQTPRSIAISPDGAWLYALNRESGSVVAFSIQDDGSLDHAGTVASVAQPTSLQFLTS